MYALISHFELQITFRFLSDLLQAWNIPPLVKKHFPTVDPTIIMESHKHKLSM